MSDLFLSQFSFIDQNNFKFLNGGNVECKSIIHMFASLPEKLLLAVVTIEPKHLMCVLYGDQGRGLKKSVARGGILRIWLHT